MNKGLYELKESPKCWNKTFNKFVEKINLKRSKNDNCFYIGENVWLILFVDDILITGCDENIKPIICELKNKFNVKDLGNVNNSLGMEVKKFKEKIKLSQSKHIRKMVERFRMTDSKEAKTPITKGFQIDLNEEIVNVPYRESIGGLMYISTRTRPDISYATSYLSQCLDTHSTSMA